MSEDGRAFRTTRDAEVCVCGRARAEHYPRGPFSSMSKSTGPFCLAFRTENPRIVNVELFRQACEHPAKFGGMICDLDGIHG